MGFPLTMPYFFKTDSITCLGKTLFYALADEFNKEEIDKFKITVGDNLFYANKFYQKMGCIKVAEIEVHKGDKSNIYVFDNKNSKL